MRFKSVFYTVFLGFLVTFSFAGLAQKAKPAAQITQEFLRFLAAQNGKHNRVFKQVLPLSLPEVYLNDSLWALVTISSESRLMARSGLHGAGPLLRMDYRLTPQDFASLKKQVRQLRKKEWAPEDLPAKTVVVQELNLAPTAHYAYSYPLVLPEKNLVLVKRRFHSEIIGNRWTCLEVYRILKSGRFQLENCYLRTSP